MSVFTKYPLIACLITAAFSISGSMGTVYAQNSTPEQSAPSAFDSQKVIAKGEGFVITEGDLIAAEDDQGMDMATVPENQKREVLVGLLIDLKSAAAIAKADKLDQTDNFKARLDYAITKTLADEYIRVELKKKVTSQSLTELYDRLAKEIKPEQEIRARHILVKEEGEAKQILERLKAGEKFEVVAREKSIDGTKDKGGDLGFFAQKSMVPEFAAAAFALDIGKLSEPVKSEFGWHIIRVDEKRERPVPSFDEVKEQLEAYQIRAAQQEIMKETRDRAKVERFDLPKKDESKVEPSKEEAAPTDEVKNKEEATTPPSKSK